ncbi:MAG: ribosomal protein S18-alanine N-acetyltransferase [Gammaproteobacteria bacterium]
MSAVLEEISPLVRPMREHDLTRIHAIEQRAYQFPWSVGVFTDCLRVGYSCWIISNDDKIVGYGIMSVAVQESHILNICIDPSWHRHGFARTLLRHMLKTAVEYDATIAYLEVRPSNQAAIYLYEQEGFANVGVRTDYYPALNGREDAYVMSKQLGQFQIV